MNIIQKIYFSFLLIAFCSNGLSSLSAQEVTEDEEITVVAPYRPEVPDAFKINVSPRIPDEKLVKPQFNYSIISKELQTNPELEPIKAARIQGESVSKLYKNYVKAGFGNYTTPYIEFHASKLHSKKNAFGVHLKHISSSGKIDDYAYPGNSHTRFAAFGKKIWKKHSLSTDVYYNRKGVHYYGFKPDEYPLYEFEKKDISQQFNTIGLSSSFKSNYSKDSKLNHSVYLDYYYLFDKYKSTEHNIDFRFSLDKEMGFFSFSEKEVLGLNAGVDYFLNKDTLVDHNTGLIKIDPYYSLRFDQYFFKLGVNTAIESDTVSSFHVYPIVHLEVKVIQDYLVTYAGLFGGIERNSYGSLSEENPFLISTVDKRNSNNKFSQYGGIKGRISKYLDYNLSFANSSIDNMAFFVNDTNSAIAPGLYNQFAVVYDYGKHSRVIAEFGFHYKDKFNALLKGEYNSYFLDTEQKAWHKPALEISLLADYNIQDKIMVRAEIFTRGKMYAKTFEEKPLSPLIATMETITEIKGMTDINLGIEYRYTKVLSGFVNFNNILGQRYYKWYNYPSYRFNMMLGVTYSF